MLFLDSDDLWTNDKLMKQLYFMIENEYDFTYNNFYVINNESEIIDERIAPEELSFRKLLKSNHIGCLTVMVKTSIIRDHLMKSIGHEDYLTWLNILSSGVTAMNTNQTLGYYRVSLGSLSNSKTKAARWQWNIYRKELKLNLIISLYYFSFYIYNGLKKNINS